MELELLFKKQYLGNDLVSWSGAIAATLVVYIITSLALAYLKRYTQRWDGQPVSVIKRGFFVILARTSKVSLAALAVLVGATLLDLTQKIDVFVTRMVVVLLFFQAGLWLSRLSTLLIEHHLKRDGDPSRQTAFALIDLLATGLVWVLVFLLSLDNLGVDVTALIAGLGIGGIAIALAVQNVLGDLLASLSIVLDKPFEVGDFIIVGDVLGKVEKIGVKTTRVRSLSGEQIVVSNTDLLNSRIKNYKRMYERRVVFTVGVAYATPQTTLKLIPGWLKEFIEAQAPVRFDRAHFKSFGDSALIFEVVYFVQSQEFNVYMDIQQAINLAIVEKFEAEKVEIAFPTRTIHVASMPEARSIS